jgi:hypothetical protein
MFQSQRSFYNNVVVPDFASLTTMLGNATLLPGDILLWRFTTHAYGTVNAAGNGIVLATA